MRIMAGDGKLLDVGGPTFRLFKSEFTLINSPGDYKQCLLSNTGLAGGHDSDLSGLDKYFEDFRPHSDRTRFAFSLEAFRSTLLSQVDATTSFVFKIHIVDDMGNDLGIRDLHGDCKEIIASTISICKLLRDMHIQGAMSVDDIVKFVKEIHIALDNEIEKQPFSILDSSQMRLSKVCVNEFIEDLKERVSDEEKLKIELLL